MQLPARLIQPRRQLGALDQLVRHEHTAETVEHAVAERLDERFVALGRGVPRRDSAAV